VIVRGGRVDRCGEIHLQLALDDPVGHARHARQRFQQGGGLPDLRLRNADAQSGPRCALVPCPFEDVRDGPGRDDATRRQDHDVIAYPLDLGQRVTAEDDARTTTVRDVAKQGEQLLLTERIQS
jgi:hypothetical protein